MSKHMMRPPDLSLLPLEERDVFARALAKDPDERWPSCRSFVEELRARVVRQDRTLVAPHTSAPGEAPEEKTRAAPDTVPDDFGRPLRSGRRRLATVGVAIVLFLSSMRGPLPKNIGDGREYLKCPYDEPRPRNSRSRLGRFM